MNRSIFVVVLTLLISTTFSHAQLSTGGTPYNMDDILNTRNVVPTYRTAGLNLEEIAIQDSIDESNGMPPRFGYKHKVDLNTENTGRWTNLPDGGRLWELDIYCPRALSVNFTFKEFWLPPSGRLFVYNTETQQKIGVFTSWNNKGSKTEPLGFATGLIYGEKVRIEYRQDEGEEPPIISLTGIVHGYKYINIGGENASSQGGARTFGLSGDCQVNVNCSPEGDDWQDEKTGVALMLINGTRVCSGSLINNSCRDGEPYFLTANHCLEDPGGDYHFDAIDDADMSTSTFIWNYEAPNCSNPSSEPSRAFVTTGASVKANVSAGANAAGTDFALLRLMEHPNEVGADTRIAFNGWYRGLPQGGGVGIHHPRVDIKKIATYEVTPVETGEECLVIGDSDGPVNSQNYWLVEWVETPNGHSVVEVGSSGSPLFDAWGRIIGFYSFLLPNCGANYCEEPGGQKANYGRFDVSWTLNGFSNSTSDQLGFWLGTCLDASALEGAYIETCERQVFASLPIVIGRTIWAEAKIFASAPITNTASSVTMAAGEEVVMRPGFSVTATNTTRFTARIEPCSFSYSPIARQSGQRLAEDEASLVSSVSHEAKVYPNPFEDGFYLEWNQLEEGKVAYIKIFNTLGQLVYEESLPSQIGHNQRYIDEVPASGILFMQFCQGADCEIVTIQRTK